MSHQHSPSVTSPPHVIAVGGVDPGCGAGLARDLLTAASLRATATAICTAWTEQSPAGVSAVEPRPPEVIHDALRETLAAGGRLAVKIGMVASAEIAAAITEALGAFDGPVVFDPVLGATSGGALYAGDLAELAPLLRRATLVTPNLHEAAALVAALRGRARPIAGEADAVAAARELRRAGISSVLVKGGHLTGAPADVLVAGDAETAIIRGTRVPGPSPRGTGCALATAIAVHLARGLDLEPAVRAARTWLVARIAAAVDRHGERQLQ